MSATWIDHPGALPTPAGTSVLGIDTEFMRRNTFYPKLALVQESHDGDCWLLDPLAYDAGPDLRALVAGRTCVMHSASEDMEALAPLSGDVPLQLFDTQIAAALCGMGAGLSYQKLVAGMLGIDIPKDETRSDWLQRPLSSSQLTYAEQDVAYLEALHDQLTQELQRRGRLAWHAEDCARLVDRAQRNRTQTDMQPQRGFATASEWQPEAQARLRRVLRWREATARQLDKPKPWIVDDAHALALAQHPPQSQPELFERVKGQRALRGPQRAELFALLREPVDPEELAKLAPIPAAPKGSFKHAADAMRQAVRTLADQLDLPPGLLCPRRRVEEFAVTRQWPTGLQGWRKDLLQARLSPLLPD